MSRETPDYDFKVNNVSLKASNTIKKIDIDLPVNSQASCFSATFYNENGVYNSYFDYHDDIKIYLGYTDTGTTGLFHGRIEKIKKAYSKSGTTIEVSGRGMWVKLMEKFTVNSYTSTDLGNIIKAEIAALITGITTTNVATTGITPTETFLDHVFISDIIADYCNKAQYFAWVDFTDDLHFTGSPGANTVSISTGASGNAEDISMDIDWKTVRNYIRAYGKQVEEVQLIKTEQDDTSIGKYGKVMKVLKNAGADTTSLVQSIVDASLLEDKESEWGGTATVYGDERIEPGKTITVNATEIGETAATYRVQHVKHSFDTGGSGFTTTVMLVQDEKNTANFYRELYEKTKGGIEFSNKGNYEESYVYKFTNDQDALWTLSGLITTDSTLMIAAGETPLATGTATITTSIVGDKNYNTCLPMVREQFPGNNGNTYQVSNDGGSTWEDLSPFGGADDAPVAHSFVSHSGDKNDLKFKITMSRFDAIIFATKTDEIIGYRPTDYVPWWSYSTPDADYYIEGLALDASGNRLYQMEGSTGKIYSCDPTTGNNKIDEADLAITIAGGFFDGTNLWIMDTTNNRVSKRNAAAIGTEDANYALPAGAGAEGYGLGWDGTDYIFTAKADGVEYTANTVWVKCNATQRLQDRGYYGGAGTYAETGAGYNSVNSKFYAVRDGTKYLMEFNVNMIAVTAALNMETVCGAAGYQPQSCCDDNVTLWSTNTNGTTNRIAKHTAGSYGTLAAATYDFAESTYGKFIGICFDGTDFWVLSQLGTYGTWYRINTSGVIQATHTITSTNSTGNLWADCEWDGSNLHATYTTKGTTNRDKIIYKFNATPTTIASELNIGWVAADKLAYDGTVGRGLAWNGTNFWITWYDPVNYTHGSWLKLANAGSYGALCEGWYPYDCCSDGTYIWFIENTSYTTKISRQTGEQIETTYAPRWSRGIEYGANVTQSKIYTLGAYLKLDY